jgi:hypothetical protein
MESRENPLPDSVFARNEAIKKRRRRHTKGFSGFIGKLFVNNKGLVFRVFEKNCNKQRFIYYI